MPWETRGRPRVKWTFAIGKSMRTSWTRAGIHRHMHLPDSICSVHKLRGLDMFRSGILKRTRSGTIVTQSRNLGRTMRPSAQRSKHFSLGSDHVCVLRGALNTDAIHRAQTQSIGNAGAATLIYTCIRNDLVSPPETTRSHLERSQFSEARVAADEHR